MQARGDAVPDLARVYLAVVPTAAMERWMNWGATPHELREGGHLAFEGALAPGKQLRPLLRGVFVRQGVARCEFLDEERDPEHTGNGMRGRRRHGRAPANVYPPGLPEE